MTTATTITMIPVADIEANPDNTRVFNQHTMDYIEQKLAPSIAALGVLQNLIIRPNPNPNPKKPKPYRIVVGECRWRASVIAGLESIPCVVRELTDVEALDLTIAENKDRENVPPIEEARAIAKYRAYGRSHQDIADKLGKSLSWVARYDRLNELVPELIEMVEGQHKTVDLSGWSMENLMLVARLSEAAQQEFAAELGRRWGRFEGIARISSADLREELDEFTRLLKAAPFKLNESYGDIDPCSMCPKRSDNQPDLFDAHEAKDAKCLDPQCWRAKTAKYIDERREQSKEKYGDALKLMAKGGMRSYEDDALPEGTLRDGQYQTCKKDAPGAFPALIVHGKGTGQVQWFQKYSWLGSTSSTPAGPKSVKEKRLQNHKLRRRIARDLVLDTIEAFVKTSRLPESMTNDKIMAAVMAFGLPHSHTSASTYNDYPMTRELPIREALKLEPDCDDEADFRQMNEGEIPGISDFEQGVDNPWALLDHLVTVDQSERLIGLGWQVIYMLYRRVGSGVEPNWGEVERACAYLDISLEPIIAQAAEAKPYPKSWRAEALALDQKDAKKAGKQTPVELAADRMVQAETEGGNTPDDDALLIDAGGFSLPNKFGVYNTRHDVITLDIPANLKADCEIELYETKAYEWRFGGSFNIYGNGVGNGGKSFSPNTESTTYTSKAEAIAAGLAEARRFFESRRGSKDITTRASKIIGLIEAHAEKYNLDLPAADAPPKPKPAKKAAKKGTKKTPAKKARSKK